MSCLTYNHHSSESMMPGRTGFEIDYTTEPPPPMRADDSHWVGELLTLRGLRGRSS